MSPAIVGQVANILRQRETGAAPPPPPPAPPPPGREGEGDDGESIDPGEMHAPNAGAEESGPDIGAEGSQDEPLSWDRVAEALGVEKAALYEVEFPTGDNDADGNPIKMKLGEVKDAMKRIRAFDEEKEQHANRVAEWELESIDARRRIHAIIDQFPPGSVPRAVVQQIEAEHAETVRREAGLLSAARPGWKDPKTSEARKAAINKVMAKYGFSATELGSVADHRMILAMDDFATALEKLDKAKAAARKVNPDDKLRPGNGQAPANTKRPSGNRRDEIASRVAALIRQRTG